MTPATAATLVELAGRLRRLEAHGLTEVPSTRLLVTTARLIAAGIPPRDACRAAMAAPLTDEPELLAWLGNFTKKPRTTFIVHGDPAAQAAFEPKVRALGFATSVPAWRETVELT